jgi:succinate-acetate transporter protein
MLFDVYCFLLMFVDFLKSKAMILVYMFALNLVFFSIAAATAGKKSSIMGS